MKSLILIKNKALKLTKNFNTVADKAININKK